MITAALWLKRIAIMLLFSALTAGQDKGYSAVVTPTYDCIVNAAGEKVSCKQSMPNGDLIVYGAGGCPECELELRVAKLEQRTNLQLRVLGEFSLMELELKQLNDKRVDRVISRHLAEIEKLVVEMKALDEK